MSWRAPTAATSRAMSALDSHVPGSSASTSAGSQKPVSTPLTGTTTPWPA